MRDDERDEPDLAPVPPYERIWRHPAERAADQRKLHEAVATPPPLSRRWRAMLATFAAVVSLLLFTVSVPKGVDTRAEVDTDTTVPSDSSSPSLPVKGLARMPAIVMAGSHGTTTALAIADDMLITALEEVTSNDTVWVTLPSGTDVEGRVSDVDPSSGIALVALSGGGTAELSGLTIRFDPSMMPRNLSLTKDTIARLRLIDWIGAQRPVPDDGVSTSRVGGGHIVHTPRDIAGIAAVANTRGDIVGIAIRRAQATWLMTMAGVRDVLTSVFGISTS